MNQDVKTKWLAALRSGEYKQTRGRLRRTDKSRFGFSEVDVDAGFCCLGVLCEVAVNEGVIEPGALVHGDFMYAGRISILPEKVMDWANIDSSDPIVKWEDKGVNYTPRLSELNDAGTYTFSYIADVIEKGKL